MNSLTKEEVKDYLFRNRLISDNNCWLLQNRKNKSYEYYEGYGIHRLSMWVFCKFDLQSKEFILHKCDNPPCWNPDHLFVGDQSDNRVDSIIKGRSPRLFGNALKEKNQTHCINGHEFTPENTAKSRGKRVCRECRRNWDRERSKGRITIKGIRYRRTQLVKKGLV